MKRIFSLFLLLFLLLFCCGSNAPKGNTIADYYSHGTEIPYIWINGLMVYKYDDAYEVVVKYEDWKEHSVVFSLNRTPSDINGLELQNITNIGNYLGAHTSDIQDVHGEFHVDVGSGFSYPGYITTDGYLVYFSFQEDRTTSVRKLDLFTNTIVEHISQDANSGK